jgi:hypothetical protein
MDFKKTTDGLFDRVGHEDLAKALGVSVATIRQARLGHQANAHRSPPDNWEAAVIRLAEERVQHFRRLIDGIRKHWKNNGENNGGNR